MKIAVVAPTEIPARRANTLQVMKMTQAFSVLGHDVRLAVPVTKPERLHAKSPSWDELSRHYGLQRKFPIDWLTANPRLRRYDYSLRAVRWARRWSADLLYTRLPQAAAIASFSDIATILEIHDLPQGFFGIHLFHHFLKSVGTRRLVVITQALADDLSQKFGAPVSPPFTIIAPDGVDLTRYADLPTPIEARISLNRDEHASLPTQIHPERFTAGYTGHLYVGRGIRLLLTLAARLPDITFLIVGGEPQDVYRLRNEVEARDLKNFILTGFVPNADLPRYQAACDVLLMPYQQRVAASSGGDISRYLSPMKLFEYMACRRAILSSDLPVLREVLTPQNALILASDDADAWATGIKSLQADPERREKLAAQAHQEVLRYTWDARAERILDGLG